MIDKETAIELARQADATPYTNRHYPDRPFFTFSPEQLEAFCTLAVAHAQKDAVHQTDWTGTPEGWTSSPAPPQKDAAIADTVGLRKAIAAGEAELRREPTAVVCDCEGATDDDGCPLLYALLYLTRPLPPGTELYTKKETK